MSRTGVSRYVLSCGLLTVPILVWNIAFTRFLPPPLSSEEFWRDIPRLLAVGENATRLIVVGWPFLMPLEISTTSQRRGLLLFVVGVSLYCLSWVVLSLLPQSRWSLGWVGFLAPAYTPLSWLVGLGLMGRKLYWPVPYRWWAYVGVAGVFVALHVTHAAIVYRRHSQQAAIIFDAPGALREATELHDADRLFGQDMADVDPGLLPADAAVAGPQLMRQSFRPQRR
jgi:hypothetical protein